MEDRKNSMILAAALALAPMVLVFPVLAAARFGPTGPQRVWPVVLYAPLAMWMQVRAIKLLLQSYRDSRDPFLLAIVPLVLVTIFGYVLHGALFILNFPAFLRCFI